VKLLILLSFLSQKINFGLENLHFVSFGSLKRCLYLSHFS
jgi:hypothetical protein